MSGFDPALVIAFERSPSYFPGRQVPDGPVHGPKRNHRQALDRELLNSVDGTNRRVVMDGPGFKGIQEWSE